MVATTAANVAPRSATVPPPATAPAPSPAASAAGPAQAPATTSAGAAVEPLTATITDRVGDATPSLLDRPPAWADLAGARLTRDDNGFELRVRLAGGRAPSSTDAEHTMNIASFYDVDGDGAIDYEVWANVSDGGWGGSWFDNRNGEARYGDDAGVTWTPEGDAIVMRFPHTHLGGASRLRWSVASEWGRYEVLTSPASARDDAPDHDQPASFG